MLSGKGGLFLLWRTYPCFDVLSCLIYVCLFKPVLCHCIVLQCSNLFAEFLILHFMYYFLGHFLQSVTCLFTFIFNLVENHIITSWLLLFPRQLKFASLVQEHIHPSRFLLIHLKICFYTWSFNLTAVWMQRSNLSSQIVNYLRVSALQYTLSSKFIVFPLPYRSTMHILGFLSGL